MSKSNIFIIFKCSNIYGILKSFSYKTAIDYAKQYKHHKIIDLLSSSCIQPNTTWTKSSIINENWCPDISASTNNILYGFIKVSEFYSTFN